MHTITVATDTRNMRNYVRLGARLLSAFVALRVNNAANRSPIAYGLRARYLGEDISKRMDGLVTFADRSTYVG